jgi:hypothetical protein
VFFDEDAELTVAEERLLQKLIFKILQGFVDKQIISKKLTYEYDKDIKSINIFRFEVKVSFKFNLAYLKINLVKLSITGNKKTPYSKGLTYLNINRIMLMNTTSLKEFKLKDLNLLYKLFSTQYVLDIYYYRTIYDDVVKITPNVFIEGGFNINVDTKNINTNTFWYNIIFLQLSDEVK